MECVRLRVKDVDFGHRAVIVRNGKGGKDRVTMLPSSLSSALHDQLACARSLWEQDRSDDGPSVATQDALARKYPSAGTQWAWFWVFSATRVALDPRTGIRRRHHVHEQALQRAIKRAILLASIAKPASTHTLTIRSRPTCSNLDRISAPCRSCSAIPT